MKHIIENPLLNGRSNLVCSRRLADAKCTREPFQTLADMARDWENAGGRRPSPLGGYEPCRIAVGANHVLGSRSALDARYAWSLAQCDAVGRLAARIRLRAVRRARGQGTAYGHKAQPVPRRTDGMHRQSWTTHQRLGPNRLPRQRHGDLGNSLVGRLVMRLPAWPPQHRLVQIAGHERQKQILRCVRETHEVRQGRPVPHPSLLIRGCGATRRLQRRGCTVPPAPLSTTV